MSLFRNGLFHRPVMTNEALEKQLKEKTQELERVWEALDNPAARSLGVDASELVKSLKQSHASMLLSWEKKCQENDSLLRGMPDLDSKVNPESLRSLWLEVNNRPGLAYFCLKVRNYIIGENRMVEPSGEETVTILGAK